MGVNLVAYGLKLEMPRPVAAQAVAHNPPILERTQPHRRHLIRLFSLADGIRLAIHVLTRIRKCGGQHVARRHRHLVFQ